jgi:DNA topoisomerase-3
LYDVGGYPPTPAMKRFAESIIRQKDIKPPAGYKTSMSICRKFLSEHAPKKANSETSGTHEPLGLAHRRCYTPRKLHKGKVSSFLTRPKLIRPHVRLD